MAFGGARSWGVILLLTACVWWVHCRTKRSGVELGGVDSPPEPKLEPLEKTEDRHGVLSVALGPAATRSGPQSSSRRRRQRKRRFWRAEPEGEPTTASGNPGTRRSGGETERPPPLGRSPRCAPSAKPARWREDSNLNTPLAAIDVHPPPPRAGPAEPSSRTNANQPVAAMGVALRATSRRTPPPALSPTSGDALPSLLMSHLPCCWGSRST